MYVCVYVFVLVHICMKCSAVEKKIYVYKRDTYSMYHRYAKLVNNQKLSSLEIYNSTSSRWLDP